MNAISKHATDLEFLATYVGGRHKDLMKQDFQTNKGALSVGVALKLMQLQSTGELPYTNFCMSRTQMLAYLRFFDLVRRFPKFGYVNLPFTTLQMNANGSKKLFKTIIVTLSTIIDLFVTKEWRVRILLKIFSNGVLLLWRRLRRRVEPNSAGIDACFTNLRKIFLRRSLPHLKIRKVFTYPSDFFRVASV